jgi:hypothetical protein
VIESEAVSLPLFFHRHRDICVRGKSDLVAFDTGNEAFIDEVVMPLVGTLSTVLLRQLDATTFDLVDGADMNAVSANDFHMLFDIHLTLLLRSTFTRAVGRAVDRRTINVLSMERVPRAGGPQGRPEPFRPCIRPGRLYVSAMEITEVQNLAIQARMALIVGAQTFDRLFAGIRFDEVDGPLLYAYARDEQSAEEIEDSYALHISIIASQILEQEIDVVVVMPKVLQ